MKVIGFLEQILRYLCKLAALFLFVIMFIISYEVIMRYAYNSPTIWAWILNQHLWLVTMLVAGVFAFQEGSHIRIEVLYDGFPPYMKRVTKYLTLILFWCFVAALIWKGYGMAASAVKNGEIARGPFPMPIYPFKVMVPIVGVLMFLQGTLTILRTNVKTGLSKVYYLEKDPLWFDILNKILILLLFWVFTILLIWRFIDHTFIMGDYAHVIMRVVITIAIILLAVAITKHFVCKNVEEEPDLLEEQFEHIIEQKRDAE